MAMGKQLTKFDVSVKATTNGWALIVRGKTISEWPTYNDAEDYWIQLTRTLPLYRG